MKIKVLVCGPDGSTRVETREYPEDLFKDETAEA